MYSSTKLLVTAQSIYPHNNHNHKNIMTIVYALVSREKTVLAEHTNATGTFCFGS